jgi:hypothetical protein
VNEPALTFTILGVCAGIGVSAGTFVWWLSTQFQKNRSATYTSAADLKRQIKRKIKRVEKRVTKLERGNERPAT